MRDILAVIFDSQDKAVTTKNLCQFVDMAVVLDLRLSWKCKNDWQKLLKYTSPEKKKKKKKST